MAEIDGEEPFYRNDGFCKICTITNAAKAVIFTKITFLALFVCVFDYDGSKSIYWLVIAINAVFMISAVAALINLYMVRPVGLLPFCGLLSAAFAVACVSNIYSVFHLIIANAVNPSEHEENKRFFGYIFVVSMMAMPCLYVALEVMNSAYRYLKKMQKQQRDMEVIEMV